MRILSRVTTHDGHATQPATAAIRRRGRSGPRAVSPGALRLRIDLCLAADHPDPVAGRSEAALPAVTVLPASGRSEAAPIDGPQRDRIPA